MYILEHKFQSTLPTRGSDVDELTKKQKLQQISIHAPHEGERRVRRRTGGSVANNFNPRSPRGGATLAQRSVTVSFATFQSTLPTRGSDKHITYACAYNILFQSTLPTRGSDAVPCGGYMSMRNFNPRSPRGGATYRIAKILTAYHISIHAPHEGERLPAP